MSETAGWPPHDWLIEPRDRDHNATLHTIYRTFGDVRSTDEVLGLLG
jgi:hypothetical protein